MGESPLPPDQRNRASSHHPALSLAATSVCPFGRQDLSRGRGLRPQLHGLTWIPDLMGHWVSSVSEYPL